MNEYLRKIVERLKKIEIKKRIFLLKESAHFFLLKIFDTHYIPEINTELVKGFQSDSSFLSKIILSSADEDTAVKYADRICKGEFRVYSLDPKLFINNLNWHKDYYSGYVWPLTSFHNIHDRNDSGVDLNVPFELSRFQFVPVLIQAYHKTRDNKYINKLVGLIQDWNKNNPYGYGINWWSCMEVGIRAVNLFIAIVYLYDRINSKTFNKLIQILWKHAKYINRYDIELGTIVSKNNHFLGALLGLFASSVCFKDDKANMFVELVREQFSKEIMNQFNSDGGNFESATAYHQFSLEIILIAIIIFRDRESDDSDMFPDKCLGEGVTALMYKALNMAGDYMTCYGSSPHFGDSSDCRVVVNNGYFDRKPLDHGFLESFGRIAINYSPPCDDSVSRIYNISGYGLFKNDNYGVVSFAGPKGTNGTGGHGHNDKCSFVLQVNGKPILVDPGTYIYNPSTMERFALKKTSIHNTVVIDGQEQSDIKPNLVFGLKSDIQSTIDCIFKDGYFVIMMSHNGYSRLDTIGIVKRNLKFMEKAIDITDSVDGSGKHYIETSFNIHPNCHIDRDLNIILIKNQDGIIKIVLPEFMNIDIKDSEFSDNYHHKTVNKIISASLEMDLPNSWKTRIEIM